MTGMFISYHEALCLGLLLVTKGKGALPSATAKCVSVREMRHRSVEVDRI